MRQFPVSSLTQSTPSQLPELIIRKYRSLARYFLYRIAQRAYFGKYLHVGMRKFGLYPLWVQRRHAFYFHSVVRIEYESLVRRVHGAFILRQEILVKAGISVKFHTCHYIPIVVYFFYSRDRSPDFGRCVGEVAENDRMIVVVHFFQPVLAPLKPERLR